MNIITKIATFLEVVITSSYLFIFKGHDGLVEYKYKLDVKVKHLKYEHSIRRQLLDKTICLSTELKTLMSYLERDDKPHYINRYEFLSKLMREIVFLKKELSNACCSRT